MAFVPYHKFETDAENNNGPIKSNEVKKRIKKLEEKRGENDQVVDLLR